MQNNFKDITGQRFGKLVVLKVAYKDKRHECHWLCKCDCGSETTTTGNRLRSGKTKSCGCIQKAMRDAGNHKSHGMTKSRLYYEWCNMKSRCDNQGNIMFKNYGGRGIKYCDAWKKFEGFRDWALNHGYNDTLTLERLDVNKNYEPDNCEWIPIEKQYLNRTDSHFLTAFGKTQTIKEWADETGLKYDTIHARIKYYGWSIEDALSVKPHEKRG